MSDVATTDVAGETAVDPADGGSEEGDPMTGSATDAAGGTSVGADLAPAATTAVGGGFAAARSGGGLNKLVNVSLNVSVELGRTRVTLAEVLDYDVGSVVELDRAAGAPVDVLVNDTLLAQGEVVLIDDEYAVRITAIFDPNNPHQ